MKKLNVAIFVTFLIVTFALVGVASAATTTISATGQAFWGSTPSRGAIVNVTVNSAAWIGSACTASESTLTGKPQATITLRTYRLILDSGS